jgi:hypothetical protein
MTSPESNAALKLQTENRPAVFGGLCLTCDHTEKCAFHRDPSRPVYFCEEFEARTFPELKVTLPQDLDAKSAPVVTLGLCVNCDHFASCTFPRSEGGVWHCEEYR